MLKYFVLLSISTYLVCAEENRSLKQESIVGFKVKRDPILKSEENEELPSRSKRSASKQKSFIFLQNRSGRTAKIHADSMPENAKPKIANNGYDTELYWRDVRNKDPPRYYRSLSASQSIAIDTYNVHEWTAKDILDRALLINGKQGVRQNHNKEDERSIFLIKSPGQRSTDIGDLYIEMMVMLDKAAVARHRNDDDIKRYVVTLLRLATSVLQHKDITQHGIRIHLVLSKLVLLRRDISEVKLDPKKRENNLRKVCTYMNKIGNSGAKRYDTKLFLTKNDFGMGGYANTNGMCSQYAGCTMVHDHGFQASFLIAHELAHTLGADDHDFGQFSGFVMSRMVDARFDAHKWSQYSQVAILANIRKFDCMKNKAIPLKGLPTVFKYPGVHYTFDRQCHLEYNDKYSAWTGRGDQCSKLKCRMPAPYTHLAKTTNSPALDGTECGFNKWCLSGTCTPKTGIKTRTDDTRINGGWGDWGQWSRCSRTCSTGIQTRERRCNKPTPSNGGKHCVGTSVEARICNTRKACPRGISDKDAVCEKVGRKTNLQRRWKSYDRSIANLDCTFETGTCGWSNGKKPGLRPWTLNKGGTPSSNTGPSTDHTLKTSKGQYIYLESSTPKKAKAVLVSPVLKARQGCLRFSYHMFGDNQMGELRVVKVSRGVSTILWKRSGNKGNKWYRQSVNVQNYNSYQLMFLAKKKGAGYKSDIALDDITFKAGPCSSTRTVTQTQDDPCKIKCITSDSRTPQKVIPSVTVYDGTACSTKTITGVCYQGKCKNVGCFNILTDDNKDKCVNYKGRPKVISKGPVRKISTKSKKTIMRPTKTTTPQSRLDCDFERSYCQWRNLPRKSRQNPRGNELNWLRQREVGKGYYLRIRQLRSGAMKVGSVTSPEAKIRSACLTFDYKLSRRGGYARLAVKYVKNQNLPRTIRFLPASENWGQVRVSFKITPPYKIVFEATLASGHTGNVGIDNIRFSPGRCQ